MYDQRIDWDFIQKRRLKNSRAEAISLSRLVYGRPKGEKGIKERKLSKEIERGGVRKNRTVLKSSFKKS